MSNSSLISYTKLSPNHSGVRTHPIDTITIHHMAGNLTVEACGALFARPSRQASSNYGIGSDGRIALYVDEANRSWCSSSNANDQRSVTIEVANSQNADPWPISDKAFEALVKLCADICRRYGKTRMTWISDKAKALAYQPAADEMRMTVHRWFSATLCPGPYLMDRMGDIADRVNRILASEAAPELSVGDIVDFKGGQHYSSSRGTRGRNVRAGRARITAIAKSAAHPYHLVAVTGSASNVYGWVDAGTVERVTDYRVQITIPNLPIHKGPGNTYGITATIPSGGVFTIVEESIGPGAILWGKLKSGAGWISLDYCKKI